MVWCGVVPTLLPVNVVGVLHVHGKEGSLTENVTKGRRDEDSCRRGRDVCVIVEIGCWWRSMRERK